MKKIPASNWKPGIGSYDFSKGLWRVRVFAFRKITNDVFSSDDADKIAEIVHYGNEVLIHGAVQKFIHGNRDADRRIMGAAKNVTDPKLLQLFHGAWIFCFFTKDAPQKVALADSAYVLACAGDDGNRCVTMVPHFFQSLTKRAVII